MAIYSVPLLASMGLLVFSSNPLVSAETQQSAVTSQNPVTAHQVMVTNAYRDKTSIMDIQITLGTAFQKGGQAKINLLDANKQIVSSIDYTLASGQKGMTAWFDLMGSKEGNYTIQVTVSDDKGKEVIETAPFSYPLV
ncbi:hypothetical protein ACVRZD_07205 [Streptococcus hongkongensis]